MIEAAKPQRKLRQKSKVIRDKNQTVRINNKNIVFHVYFNFDEKAWRIAEKSAGDYKMFYTIFNRHSINIKKPDGQIPRNKKKNEHLKFEKNIEESMLQLSEQGRLGGTGIVSKCTRYDTEKVTKDKRVWVRKTKKQPKEGADRRRI